ncbi:MAG: single-stranded DNA-binding protein [Lachnospiraceae bacterium]|nr:single-stranded DNA-binding protein [Lachnospiraceae bacterium]
MNRVILMGRLTKDPEIRYSQNDTSMAIARFSLAVDRRRNQNSDGQTADFINIVAFGKLAEFSEKYLHKGTKVALEGRIQTGSYTNKDGAKVYTTDVIADNIEFAESKGAEGSAQGRSDFSQNSGSGATAPAPADDGFMNIPDGIDEELPFS